MPNELPLPSRVGDIDSEIQSLEFMKQSLESLVAVRNSLDETSAVLGQMKTDLKGDSLSIKDFVTLEADANGNPTVTFNTDKIDPSKIDLTEFPADLVSQAIDTQKALEEILAPFAQSQSQLLSSLEKIQTGLTQGSDAFGKVGDAIKRVQQAWDLFDTAMEGDISSDQLIDAFDKYFSGMLDVLADTVGKVPGLGAFLSAYAKAIHNIIPTLHSISADTLAKNEAIANVFSQPTGATTTTATSARDVLTEQVESLDARIQALNDERWELLDEAQREAAKNARIEIDQFWDEAGRNVDRSHPSDWSYQGISELVFEQMTALWIAWPNKLARLRAKDPNDPEIAVIEAKMAKTAAELKANWGIQIDMREQRVVELENLVRTRSHVLQEADLQELVNRFPQLEDAANDIRAGNPAGTPIVPAPAPAATIAAPAVSTGISGKVKAAVGVGVVALAAFGAFLFSSGGSDCPDTGALSASGVHISAAADPCPGDDLLALDGDPDTTKEDGSVDDGATDADEDKVDISTGEDPVVEETPAEEPVVIKPTFTSLTGGISEAMLTAGSKSFPDLIETVDNNADAVYDASGPIILDPPGDQIYSDPNVEPGVRAFLADINVTDRFQVVVEWTDFDGTTGPGGDLGCDRADDLVVVVCPQSDRPLPDEPGAWVFVGINGTVPSAEGSGELIYSYVVETDGDPANDWQPQGPYTWDFYQDADTWFELFGDIETGTWEAAASRVTTDQQIEPIDLPFRVIIWDDTIWWWIPESSAPSDAPFRVSAFSHDGTYDPRFANGDVPGADPTEGLFP